MNQLVDSLKALADMTRLKIFKLISTRELCVCELAEIMQISQSAISQHLRKLKQVNLATERREGQWIYYRANEESADSFLAAFADFAQNSISQIPELKPEFERMTHVEESILVRTCKFSTEVELNEKA